MDFNNVLPFLACIIFLFIFGKIFILPLKSIMKLIINSVLGGILIFIINTYTNKVNFLVVFYSFFDIIIMFRDNLI